MARPREHRKTYRATTYCSSWIRSLRRIDLDYEIVVLEVLKDTDELAEAERWWIAYGRACRWPLTNTMSGGYPSSEVILKRQRRNAESRAAWEAASEARVQALRIAFGEYPPQRIVPRGIPAEIERRCFQFFNEHATGDDLINAVIANVRVTQETATCLYAKWHCARAAEAAETARRAAKTAQRVAAIEAKRRCFQLFEQRIGCDNLIAVVAVEADIARETVERLYKEWLHISMRRSKRALEEDRRQLLERLRGPV